MTDYVKTFDVLRVIAIVPILALTGIVIATVSVSLLINQSSNATIIPEGKIQENGSDTTITHNDEFNSVVGRMFLNGTDTLTSFNPINETYNKISYAGDRTIIPPNTTTAFVLNATEIGNLTMNLQPNGITIVKGQSLITTHLDNNNGSKQEKATGILVDLNGVRPNDPRSSTGVAFFSTNSTGQLRFLDDMIAIYQVNASPEGTDIRMWEWKGADLQFE